MMELPNHLVTWDTVKKLLKQAKRDAWEEGNKAAGIMLPTNPPRYPTNPYQEDE